MIALRANNSIRSFWACTVI
ncbi:hypothetical protein YPPY36_1315, partial [Yersinia pestis PY-36]